MMKTIYNIPKYSDILYLLNFTDKLLDHIKSKDRFYLNIDQQWTVCSCNAIVLKVIC